MAKQYGAKDPTPLLIFRSEIISSYKEIVYPVEVKYDGGWRHKRLMLVDHEDYRINKTLFERYHIPWDNVYVYAFGIKVNAFNTQLVLLDYDDVKLTEMYAVARELMEMKEVQGVDIFQSSKSNMTMYDNYHIHIALDKKYNVMPFIQDVWCCKGYKKGILDSGEMILRVSQKFGLSNDTTPTLWKGYRKENNIIQIYESTELMFPIGNGTIEDEITIVKDKKQIRNLRLR